MLEIIIINILKYLYVNRNWKFLNNFWIKEEIVMEIIKYLEWIFYLLYIKMCVLKLKYICSKFVDLRECIENKIKWKRILKYVLSV